MSQATRLDLNRTEEAKFEAAKWHLHSVSFCSNNFEGIHDKDFGRFFASAAEKDSEERRIWMKVHIVAEQSEEDGRESGFRFLAFDPVDGSIWFQNAESLSEVSAAVEEFNQGLEFEDEILLSHIEDVVKGKRDGIKWRFVVADSDGNDSAVSPILGFISFRAHVGKIALDFKFDCQKVFWEKNEIGQSLPLVHLIQPFYMSTQFLTGTTAELIKIIEKKDKEIQDYKNQGGKVSRKYIATLPFDAEAFTVTRLEKFKLVHLNTDDSEFLEVMEIDEKIKKRWLEITLEEQKNLSERKKEKSIVIESHPTDAKTAQRSSDVPLKPVQKAEPTETSVATDVPKVATRTRSAAKTTRKVVEAESVADVAVRPIHIKKKRGLF